MTHGIDSVNFWNLTGQIWDKPAGGCGSTPAPELECHICRYVHGLDAGNAGETGLPPTGRPVGVNFLAPGED
jgi:hypothetical protein